MTPVLWTIAGLSSIGLLITATTYSDLLWLNIAVGVLCLGAYSALAVQYRAALKSRSAAYGAYSSAIVMIVISIIGVLNFLSYRHSKKWDLTKNKVNSLSDQTTKLVKGLSKPVKAALFAKTQQKEQFRVLLENYRSLSPKFEVEYVDPDKEPTRTKQIGIKKYGTLHLTVGTRETNVEEPNEEKLTNALIKILKNKSPALCAITGHGEKNMNGQDADGYSSAKKSLTDQAYEVRELNLLQENKIPETCDAIAVLGPTKSFFAPEIKAIEDYLSTGGRAIIAVDLNLKGGEYSPEMLTLLGQWRVRALTGLVVDPLSRMLGVDAAVPILATYSKDNAITKDFQTNCYFPFTRPLVAVTETAPGTPNDLKVQWLAQTTPKSWAIMDLKSLAGGQAKYVEGRDKMGPISTAFAVEGKQKDSKATRNTRLVVFGTSVFATNNYSRFGGNLDFFLNATSWVMEDESLISIRAKDDGVGRVELSREQGTLIFLLTVVIIPILVAAAGIVIWAVRRRM